MNKDWSDKNKKMQTLISKEATFAEGIKVLLELRAELFEQITSIVKLFRRKHFISCRLAKAMAIIRQLLPGRSGIHSALKILSRIL